MSSDPQPGARLGGLGEASFPPPAPAPAAGAAVSNSPFGTLMTSHPAFLDALNPTERVALSPACMTRYFAYWLLRPKPEVAANRDVKWSVAETCVHVCVGFDSAAKHTMIRSPVLKEPRLTLCDDAA